MPLGPWYLVPLSTALAANAYYLPAPCKSALCFFPYFYAGFNRSYADMTGASQVTCMRNLSTADLAVSLRLSFFLLLGILLP